jgi:hypothetical protein
MKIPIRKAFKKHLELRYSLRLHMVAILLATALSGVLFSKVLLFFGVVDFRIRYPLSVVFAYLVFFACIRLWLACISSNREAKTSGGDWLVDFIPSPSSGSGGGKEIPSFSGGGGRFAGAGASASFESPDQTFVKGAILADSQATSGGSASKGVGEALGDAAGSLGDDNIIVAVIVLVVLVVTILASATVLVHGAPDILSEAAFEGLLAVSLIRRARVFSEKAWTGSILKTTWKPFAVILGVSFFSGVVLHNFFPHAVKLTDILWKH